MHNDPGELPRPDITSQPGMRPLTKRRTLRFVNWIKTHRRASLLIGGALLIIGALTTAYWVYAITEPTIDSGPDIHAVPRPTVYYSPLTGIKVKDEAATKQTVTAIVLENSPDARPHSGLKQAGIAYEAIAEGGITRYVALYQEAKPALVGPVRSLRPYFLSWIAPFEPSIAHVGGSKKALDEVRNGTYRDIDEFFNAGSYWRATDRYAPHNVYTSFEKLDALNKSKKYTASSFTAWERQDGEAVETPDATSITIDFSSALYNTKYTYNAKTNDYSRFLGGVAHMDREKGQITPSVVIAMLVDETTVMEDGARESIQTIGSGTAYIFQNGTVQKATWKKKAQKTQIQWLDSQGKEIPLNRGQTWIAAVPTSGRGNVSW